MRDQAVSVLPIGSEGQQYGPVARRPLGPPSAESAVDDDFSQSGFESGEVVIVEPLNEQARHTAKMDRHCFGQACDTSAGQDDNYAAPVPSGVRSSY